MNFNGVGKYGGALVTSSEPPLPIYVGPYKIESVTKSTLIYSMFFYHTFFSSIQFFISTNFHTHTHTQTRLHLVQCIWLNSQFNNGTTKHSYLTSMDMHRSSQERLPYECNYPHVQDAVGAAITFAPTTHDASLVPVNNV